MLYIHVTPFDDFSATRYFILLLTMRSKAQRRQRNCQSPSSYLVLELKLDVRFAIVEDLCQILETVYALPWARSDIQKGDLLEHKFHGHTPLWVSLSSLMDPR